MVDNFISSCRVSYPLVDVTISEGGIINHINTEFLFWVYCSGGHWNLPFNTSFKYKLPIPFGCHYAPAAVRRCKRLFSFLHTASARLGHTTLYCHLDFWQLCVCVCEEFQLHLVLLLKQQGSFNPNLCSSCVLPLSRIPHLSLLLGWSLAKAKGLIKACTACLVLFNLVPLWANR